MRGLGTAMTGSLTRPTWSSGRTVGGAVRHSRHQATTSALYILNYSRLCNNRRVSTPTQAPLDADIADVIRGAGLKFTTPRGAVLRALRDHPHASADDVLSRVAVALPKASLQSVYNALSDFVSAGIVRRFRPAGSPGLYELRVDDNHHHLVCTQCAAVSDVDCAVGHVPCLTPSNDHGFVVHTAEVTYWGLCAACAATTKTTTIATTTETTTG